MLSSYYWCISKCSLVCVILSNISATRVCTSIGAAVAFSNSSGDSTLEYSIICQCKHPLACGSITPFNAATWWYAGQSYIKKSWLWCVCDDNLHPLTASSKMSNLWWKFWACKRGQRAVIINLIAVLLRTWSGKSICLKPCFEISDNLDHWTLDSYTIAMSVDPQIQEEHPWWNWSWLRNKIAFNVGRVAAHSNGLNRIVDPTIDRMWQTLEWRLLAFFECGWSLA